jgi:hypothetical protein
MTKKKELIIEAKGGPLQLALTWPCQLVPTWPCQLARNLTWPRHLVGIIVVARGRPL